MPFIGNQPALSYTSFAKQDFTTSATTSYSLDHPVANANELALFINFVRQEPTTSYSASGTTLTLTSATSSSDDMYCVYLGKAVQTVNPPNASVGASQIVDGSIALGKLSASGTKDATTFLRGDNTFAVAGGTNTPAFSAYQSSNQSIANTTMTTVIFNQEDYDTDNAFASNTFTVPSGKAGKYFLYAQAGCYGFSANRFFISIRKNTTDIAEGELNGTNQYPIISTSIVEQLSVGDAITARVYHDSGGTRSLTGNNVRTYIYGYRIIE